MPSGRRLGCKLPPAAVSFLRKPKEAATRTAPVLCKKGDRENGGEIA